MVRSENPPGGGPATVVVSSDLGWLALCWEGGSVTRLTFGHDSPQAACRELGDGGYGAGASEPLLLESSSECRVELVGCERSIGEESGGGEANDVRERRALLVTGRVAPGAPGFVATEIVEVVSRLVAFAAGAADDLRSIPLDLSRLTDFRRRVTEACRAIPYGETLTYAELAARVGSPRGARAVGNVMRTNPWPLVVPCHRVVGSSGGLGGYSAPDGLAMKRRLLELEAAALSRGKSQAARQIRQIQGPMASMALSGGGTGN